MRATAVALAIAVAVGGCGTQWWDLDPVADSSASDAGSNPATDAGTDVQRALACTSDNECAQPFPQCDLLSDTLSHRCVECLDDGHCGPEQCDPQSHQCVQCVDDSHCTQPFLHRCGLMHQCVECVLASHCRPGQICEVNQCVFTCPDGGGCPTFAPKCNPYQERFLCAECLTCDDCVGVAAGPVCDTNSGRCGEANGSSRGCAPDAGGSPDSGDDAADASMDASSATDAPTTGQ